MKIEKLPFLNKSEYDDLIKNQYICRVSYQGEKYPQIKPFLYTFDGSHIYILVTKYGKKLHYLKENPLVTVEIESYKKDLSDYKFVTLSGRLIKIEEEEVKKKIRKIFVKMMEEKGLSKNILIALGHSRDEPLEALVEKERNFVFKLTEVKKISGFKNGKSP